MINDEQLDKELDHSDARTDSDEDLKKHHEDGIVDNRRQSVTRASVGIEDTFQPDMQIIAEHDRKTLDKA